MPIYEYRCTQCQQITEEWVRSFDSPQVEPCPHCGADAVRIVSETSFHLKGGGWYVTDYKKSGASGGGSESASAPTGTAASADAASSASSETASSETASSAADSSTAPATPPPPASSTPSTSTGAAGAAA